MDRQTLLKLAEGLDWRDEAQEALEAVGSRQLTTSEKIALASFCLDLVGPRFKSSPTIEMIGARCPLSVRQLCALLSNPKHLARINANLGTSYEYRKGEYRASGRGAFGLSRGGARGRREPPRLVQRQ